jgi:hypothetical protein
LDLLVYFRGNATLIEIKDGAKSRSRKKLTPAEVDTIAQILAVGGRVAVVESVDEALQAIGIGLHPTMP